MTQTRRLVTALFGEPKTGKTHMALTFPEPIYFFDLDYGTEGVIERFDGKQVEFFRYPVYPFATPAELAPVVEKFRHDIRRIHESAPPGATVAIDTASELDDFVMKVTVNEWLDKHPAAKGKQVPQLAYGERNSTMASFLTMPLWRSDLNAAFIHRAKKEYQDDKPTGRLELAGWAGATGIAQVTVQTLRAGKGWKGRVALCRPTPSVEGSVFDELTYEMLMAVVWE